MNSAEFHVIATPFDLGMVPSQNGRGDDDGTQPYAGHLAHAINCGDSLSIKHFFARAFDLTTTSNSVCLGPLVYYNTFFPAPHQQDKQQITPNSMPKPRQFT